MPLPVLSPETMGSQMVRLLIGETAQPFLVHKKLLCDRFPHFSRPVNLAFYGHGSTDVVFSQYKVEVMEAIIVYLYQGELPHFGRNHGEISLNFLPGSGRMDFRVHSRRLRNLFYFAEKIDDKPLMNQVMDKIQDDNAAHNYLFSQEEIREVYANSESFNGLKHYIVILLANAITQGENELLAQAYTRLATEMPPLGEDIRYFIEFSEYQVAFNPHIVGARSGRWSCLFHEHRSHDEVERCRDLDQIEGGGAYFV
ncbi:hypothetical protein DSL72_008111 [Monilinia vaccinii-corymbosi]|uniref:BTB domain-containing protein n=1 Tax=Monilinia vaccinii-corymbosi TaxID=61207 RepID=A0A8A3PIX6_9HELO|nr:hypothetical protein DSL72_008111 [Monilinia vaccinii-corymbosi]